MSRSRRSCDASEHSTLVDNVDEDAKPIRYVGLTLRFEVWQEGGKILPLERLPLEIRREIYGYVLFGAPHLQMLGEIRASRARDEASTLPLPYMSINPLTDMTE